MEEEYLIFGHKWSCGYVPPETSAETREVYKRWNRTRVHKMEERSREEDEGSKGRVDWGAVQEHREENDVRKRQKTQQHKSAVIEGRSGNDLTESTAVLNRWISTAVGYTTTNSMREQVEEAVHSLKAGKVSRSGLHSLWALKNGGEATTAVLIALCQKIQRWKNGRRSGQNRSS